MRGERLAEEWVDWRMRFEETLQDKMCHEKGNGMAVRGPGF